jgi:CHAT domain-containing protein
LKRLGEAIRTEQIRLDTEQEFSDRTYLKQLKGELNTLIEQQIIPVDPTFAVTKEGKVSLGYEDIVALLDEHTGILEWYLTREKLLIFILTPPNSLECWQFELQPLIDWFLDEYLKPYYQIEKASEEERNELRFAWIEQLPLGLSKLAEILHLPEILPKISCQKLILIPHRLLHLLPLHALPINDSQVLFDKFPLGVSYAPSCTLLHIIRKRPRPHFDNLLALDNPTEDLNYTKTEIAKLLTLFPQAENLSRKEASQENLTKYPHLASLHCLHFSCHGKFNFSAPLESCLLLSDEPLKLGDVFNLSLPSCRLVTLCACETGLSDLKVLSDEYVGLPSGFIFAGSNAVVSSLWAVEELPTAIFMIEFYRRLKAGEKLELALMATQSWLRGATKNKLKIWIQENALSLDAVQKEYLELRLSRAKEIPFDSVYYWGAFAAIGE